MLFGEDTAARIAGIGYQNCRRIGVNQRFHLLQIDLPITFGNQVVVANLDAHSLGQGIVDGETGTGTQNIVAI